MSNRAPAYPLSEVQALVRQGRYSITLAAEAGAAALNIQKSGIVQCVLGLRKADFYKSMPAVQVPGMWQDVYRPRFRGVRLYVKLQIAASGRAVVVSFKRL